MSNLSEKSLFDLIEEAEKAVAGDHSGHDHSKEDCPNRGKAFLALHEALKKEVAERRKTSNIKERVEVLEDSIATATALLASHSIKLEMLKSFIDNLLSKAQVVSINDLLGLEDILPITKKSEVVN